MRTILGLFLGGALLAGVACGSDDNAAPPPTDFANGGSAGATTAGGSGGAPAGGSNAGGSNAGGSPATGGSAGCFSGTPTTTLDFLNHCTTGTCTPFDNKTRIPNFDGTLPPLPQ